MSRGRELYDNMLVPCRHDVDAAFMAMYNLLAGRGYLLARDDRAERLVDAIAIYLEESKKP